MCNKKIGIILLAAGGSRRLGSPKQLVPFEGTSLIKYVAVTALISEYPTVVVLGAFADKVGEELNDLSVEKVVNKEWKKGMGGSIHKGLAALRAGHLDLEAVILMLCDQPKVSPLTIHRLVDKYSKTGMPIVASKYDDTVGVPALFGYEMFGELLALEGKGGAKALIDKYEDTLVTTVRAPEAKFDVDTPEDVEALNRLAAAA